MSGRDLIQLLLESAEKGTSRSDDVRKALLEFGSETPDNCSAVGCLSFGSVPDKSEKTGLFLTASQKSLSHLMNQLEDFDEVADLLLEKQLVSSRAEVEAALRTVTLILVALEGWQS